MTEIAAELERSGRIRLVLVAYGVALAVMGTTAWIVAIPDSHVSLQTSRQTAIEQSIGVLDRGGPPLVVPDASGGYKPANTTDDEGI